MQDERVEDFVLVVRQLMEQGVSALELKQYLQWFVQQREAGSLHSEEVLCKTKQVQSIPPLREALKQKERELIQLALAETKGNVLQAAKILQIPRQTLQYKLKQIQA